MWFHAREMKKTWHNKFVASTLQRLPRRDQYHSWLLVFLLFFLTSPYFFWDWYGNLLVTILVSTVAMLIIWKHKEKVTGKKKAILTFYVCVWLLYLFNEFIKGARLGVVAYMPYVLLGFVPFINKDLGRYVFNKFVTVYAILIGLSMVSWILAMTGMISPIGELGVGNESLEAQNKSYLVYPLSLISIGGIGIYDFGRFGGFFDEPGVVGTLGGLMLCALRYNMRDWRSIVILFSGLLSASMFFYGWTAVYWILQLLLVKKKYGVMLLLVSGIMVSYQLTKDNAAVSYLVWDRFEWDSEKGGFAGNTREGEKTTMTLERMNATGEIWFGVEDKEAYWDEMKGTASIYNVFAMYGIIFTALYITWLIAFGYHYRINRWDFLLYCIMVLGCMYQRPNMFDLPFTFLFVSTARYTEFQLDSFVTRKEYKTRGRE